MHSCNICDYKSKDRFNYRRHLSSVSHEKECSNNLACKKCLQRFGNQGAYAKHVKTCNIELCPVIRKSKKQSIEISTQVQSQPQPQIVINNYIDCNFSMTISDLIKDPFTTSNHRLILHQMEREESTLSDYITEIDESISETINIFNEDQIQLLEDEYISKIKDFVLTFKIFWEHAIKILCKSTQRLVVTHRDLTVDGSRREILFKHEKKLHADSIIRELVKQSKYYSVISDFTYKIERCPPEYADLLIILYEQAMRRKNEHNRNIVIANARR